MSIKNIIEHWYPDSKLLLLDKVKQLTVEITGISPITDHMCIKSCVAYTGPFKALDTCPVFNEPHSNSQHWPRQVFLTIPVGPLLQELRRSKDKAIALHYRTLHTEALLLELANDDSLPKHYSNFLDGSQYLEAVDEGLIKEDDIVLMLSLDGAQLFVSKQSNCWICIWVVFDHSLDVCYKKPSVLPAFTIPGPNPPWIGETCLFFWPQKLSVRPRRRGRQSAHTPPWWCLLPRWRSR